MKYLARGDDPQSARRRRSVAPRERRLSQPVGKGARQCRRPIRNCRCHGFLVRFGKTAKPVEDELVEPAITDPETELPANVEHDKVTEQMDARRDELRIALQGQVLAYRRQLGTIPLTRNSAWSTDSAYCWIAGDQRTRAWCVRSGAKSGNSSPTTSGLAATASGSWCAAQR